MAGRGDWRAVVVLAVFSLHNAWNCWCVRTVSSHPRVRCEPCVRCSSRESAPGAPAAQLVPTTIADDCSHCPQTRVFLNFTNFGPAMGLLGVGAAELGFITTAGWLGILLAVPVVTVCPGAWQRTLLFVAGLLNVAPAGLRYWAASEGRYELVGCHVRAATSSRATPSLNFGPQLWPRSALRRRPPIPYPPLPPRAPLPRSPAPHRPSRALACPSRRWCCRTSYRARPSA